MKKSYQKTTNDFIKNFSENRGHPLKIILGFFKGEEKILLKKVLKAVKGTDVEILLRESGLIK